MLKNDNKWWQGCILTMQDAYKLQLVDSLKSDRRVIVISHDCDLVRLDDIEEFVEVIVARVVPKLEGSYENAKNPRRLHLKIGSHLYLELRQAYKCRINNQEFIKLNSPDQELVIFEDEKRTLKQWLAAYYGRSAFPNAFESRLRRQHGKHNVVEKIEKILKPSSMSCYLLGLFFDLGRERFVELKNEEPYFLSISVAYNSENGKIAREAAEKVAANIKTLFHTVYGLPDSATEIVLEKCEAVADTQITLADIRKTDQWRVEYISLRERPVEKLLLAGAY